MFHKGLDTEGQLTKICLIMLLSMLNYVFSSFSFPKGIVLDEHKYWPNISDPGFLTFDTITTCGDQGFPVDCRMFGSTPELYILERSFPPSYGKISPGTAQCPQGRRIILIENHWSILIPLPQNIGSLEALNILKRWKISNKLKSFPTYQPVIVTLGKLSSDSLLSRLSWSSG